MESGIQSSFIPKDAGKQTVAPRLERGGALGDLLLLFSIVIFVASGALAGATFLYKQYLINTSKSKLAELQTAKNEFEPALIDKFTRLDERMRAADTILTSHLAPTTFFHALEQATLATVSFGSLDLETGDSKHISAHMEGVAQSVNSIALEADLLSKNGVLTNPIFSGISRQQDGVHFDLQALVNPAAIGYIDYVKNGGQSAGEAIPQSQTQIQGFPQTGVPPPSVPTPVATPPAQTIQQSVTPPATTAKPPSTVSTPKKVPTPVPTTTTD